MKLCYTCNTTKELTEFSKDKNKRDGLRSQCKSCRTQYQKSHSSKNVTRAKSKRYNKEIARFKPYGITKLDYDNMIRGQGGVCAICKGSLTYSHIDHCHVSNIVRGVLCSKCNNGLGMFNDDPDLMQAAIKYLIR